MALLSDRQPYMDRRGREAVFLSSINALSWSQRLQADTEWILTNVQWFSEYLLENSAAGKREAQTRKVITRGIDSPHL